MTNTNITIPAGSETRRGEIEAHTRVLTRERMMAGLKSCAGFMCKDVTRFHLNCVAIEFGPGVMRFVSTDGHTLAKAEVPATVAPGSSAGAPKTFLLPSADVRALIKILAYKKHQADQQICISIDGRQLALTVDGEALTYRSMDAAFPPYEQVIPKDIDGGCGSLGLNPVYVARACDAIKDFGRATDSSLAARFMTAAGDLDPVRITWCSPDCGDFTAVIMPMRM